MADSNYNEFRGAAYHGIPDAKEREAMSVLALAEEMVKHQNEPKDSVPYIVLSHELNIKLAKLQAKATLNAGWLGASATIIAVFIAAALGYFIGASQTKEPNDGKREKTSASQGSQPVTATIPTKNAQKAGKNGPDKQPYMAFERDAPKAARPSTLRWAPQNDATRG